MFVLELALSGELALINFLANDVEVERAETKPRGFANFDLNVVLASHRAHSTPRMGEHTSQGPTRAAVIIGTAGHIDHGKTTLVRALTGVNTDRLSEEQKRGITIVLGFAPLELPGGTRAGVIDVPGHERFVRTMVAGAGGVDVGLLVVSADEGVMPQTREHLAILGLLEVPELVIGLTRADLVDADLIELASLELEELLADGPWAEASVVPCSGLTGEGVDDLRAALAAAAERLPPRATGEVFRLPVDRSFSIRGFGTVVTGTTRDGRLQESDPLEVLPGRQRVRLRGIQVHGEERSEVGAGTRVALNIQGTPSGAIPPGSWLATPGALACSDRIDVLLDLLPDAPRALENNSLQRFLCGTAEVMATVRLMAADGGPAPECLEPGQSTLAQLALAEEVSAVAGDRFVLRSESPMWTVGGGRVLDPEPPLLRRRSRPPSARLHSVLARLESTPGERLCAFLERSPGRRLDRDELRRRLPADCLPLGPLVAALAEDGRVAAVPSEPPSWVGTLVVSSWVDSVREQISAHHSAHPMLDGPQLSELRQALRPEPEARVFEALVPTLCAAAGLERRGARLAMPAHESAPGVEQRALMDRLVSELSAFGTSPPALGSITVGMGLHPDALPWLLDRGELVKVADDYVLARDVFQGLVRRLAAHLGEEGAVISPGQFKELSGLTRKHAIPFLECLDAMRITVRKAEGRALRELPDWARSS